MNIRTLNNPVYLKPQQLHKSRMNDSITFAGVGFQVNNYEIAADKLLQLMLRKDPKTSSRQFSDFNGFDVLRQIIQDLETNNTSLDSDTEDALHLAKFFVANENATYSRHWRTGEIERIQPAYVFKLDVVLANGPKSPRNRIEIKWPMISELDIQGVIDDKAIARFNDKAGSNLKMPD